MRKLCTACLVALTLISSLAVAQRPRFGEDQEPRGFRCRTGQRLSPVPDSALVFVAISVPYDNLTFVRGVESGFVSHFGASFVIIDDDDRLAAERDLDMDVYTESFKETNSRTLNAVRTEEFYIAPGDYKVSVTITDHETKRKRRWSGKVSAVIMDSLLSVSDLYWVDSDTVLDSQNTPRVIENFSNREEPATVAIDLVSAAPESLQITWRVTGEDGDTAATQTEKILPSGEVEHFEYSVVMQNLPVQKYTVEFEALGDGRREARTVTFNVNIPGIPASINDLGEAIRQVKYIGSAEENRRLRSASTADREQLFREFWKRRDPTPETQRNELMEEYYYRVELANEKYSTNRPGWETDRGRIFIMYGEPSDIERHPFESGSRPYEIWYYHNINRRFVFVDYTGFGDYTLSGPQLGY
ncbi:MAG: GWxTD domain-containing protein [Calditrichaeota bacterium]|nr:GWxTD domain-containing protein [Calditrichota bacterium]MCB9368699.1 GWxTD domain-containing protein [Calditrichota bacterium]